jgi:hypothetical protein
MERVNRVMATATRRVMAIATTLAMATAVRVVGKKEEYGKGR